MKNNVIRLSDDTRMATIYYIDGQHKVDYFKDKKMVKEDYFLTQYDALHSARNFTFTIKRN